MWGGAHCVVWNKSYLSYIEVDILLAMKEICVGAYLASAPLQRTLCHAYSEVPALWMATMGREDMLVPLSAPLLELAPSFRSCDGWRRRLGLP